MIQLQPLHDRVVIGDEDYVIMREREILGRIGIIEKAKRARK
jgi:hypothetical protein